MKEAIGWLWDLNEDDELRPITLQVRDDYDPNTPLSIIVLKEFSAAWWAIRYDGAELVEE